MSVELEKDLLNPDLLLYTAQRAIKQKYPTFHRLGIFVFKVMFVGFKPPIIPPILGQFQS